MGKGRMSKTKKMLKYYGYWKCNICGAELHDLDEIEKHQKEHERAKLLSGTA